MERKNDHHETREFIDRRLSESDRRRDVYLSEKLEAIEKLFNLTISTKSEALSVAVSRMQVDSKDCLSRCSNQVRIFYDKINELREKDIAYQLQIEIFDKEYDEHRKEYAELVIKVDTLKISYDELLQWKQNFWVRNLTSAVAASIVTFGVAFKGLTWAIDLLSKMKVGM